MNKINRTMESPSKSYLVEATTYNDLGNRVLIPGVISEDTCRKNAKRNHRMCEGRGILHFDNGRYFYDKDGQRHVLVSWIRSCDCVSRQLIKNEDCGNFTHLIG